MCGPYKAVPGKFFPSSLKQTSVNAQHAVLRYPQSSISSRKSALRRTPFDYVPGGHTWLRHVQTLRRFREIEHLRQGHHALKIKHVQLIEGRHPILSLLPIPPADAFRI